MNGSQRLAIIGAGHVGATAAYTIMLRALFPEIVLVDSDSALAHAEAEDLADASVLGRPVRIWAGDYTDAAAARIAVVTAGAATHGSEPRTSVASKSAAIVAECVGQLIDAGFDGILIVAANPVDVMAMVAFNRSGLRSGQVIGTGTLLDTCRLRRGLAGRTGVAAASVDGLVLGEHGDSEAVMFSQMRIGGLDLGDFLAPAGEPNHDDIATGVRRAAYEIIEGKGYTSFGIASAIARICEAIIRDEHVVLPVSSLLSGQFGIDNVYLSLPCLLGKNGISKVLLPPLSESEEASLRASGEVVKAAFAALLAAKRSSS